MPGRELREFVKGDHSEDLSSIAHEAKIARDASSIDDELAVTVEAFSPSFLFKPCRWIPRTGDDGPILPRRGDAALLVITPENTYWVAAYWSASSI